ncbi:S8 family serine peptidase [Candidatus Enterovibrio escicola]|uniref:S8 family serine peptidase n=1 Tax=Candidatus Enterovibrio escicola TaxID=1927127 RepID=UPI001CC2260B|nr:S8 family serine peptidase [Candidatus Enterovibrio escacola]
MVVFKESVFSPNGETLQGLGFSAGQSVQQVAERLIDDVTDRTSYTTTSSTKNKRGHVYSSALKGFSATLTPEAAKELKKKAKVHYVMVDGVTNLNQVSLNDIEKFNQDASPSWGLDRIDQISLPFNNKYTYNNTGIGVHAYILDSGIRASHQEFIGRIGNGYDVINKDSDPDDCLGQGTPVVGTLGGTRYGIAKNVTLHGVKVFGCTNTGFYSDILAGVDWIAKNHIKPAIVNLNITTRGPISPLDDAIFNSFHAGIVYIVSASNRHGADACSSSPAREPTAITLASIAAPHVAGVVTFYL